MICLLISLVTVSNILASLFVCSYSVCQFQTFYSCNLCTTSSLNDIPVIISDTCTQFQNLIILTPKMYFKSFDNLFILQRIYDEVIFGLISLVRLTSTQQNLTG